VPTIYESLGESAVNRSEARRMMRLPFEHPIHVVRIGPETTPVREFPDVAPRTINGPKIDARVAKVLNVGSRICQVTPVS